MGIVVFRKPETSPSRWAVYLLRKREVIPWTSWMTSPWRTGRGGLLTTSSCLTDRKRERDRLDRDYISQHATGQTGDLPAGVFDDPPVVDVFERITGDLLLVRAAPPIFIPEHTQTGNKKWCYSNFNGQLSDWLLCQCELAAPDWVVGFVRVEPAGDWLGGSTS